VFLPTLVAMVWMRQCFDELESQRRPTVGHGQGRRRGPGGGRHHLHHPGPGNRLRGLPHRRWRDLAGHQFPLRGRAIRADRSVRLVHSKRSWRGEVATWQDRPDVALIRVAGEIPTLSVPASPTVGIRCSPMAPRSGCRHRDQGHRVGCTRRPPRPTPRSTTATPGGPPLNACGEVVGIISYDLEAAVGPRGGDQHAGVLQGRVPRRELLTVIGTP
jgi:hypothetical protein